MVVVVVGLGVVEVPLCGDLWALVVVVDVTVWKCGGDIGEREMAGVSGGRGGESGISV